MIRLMRVVVLIVLGLSLALTGCSAEGKAQKKLKKYAKVFKICKKLATKRPNHRCKKISSMALEMTMKKTGLAEDKWRPMVKDWASSNGFAEIYISQSK